MSSAIQNKIEKALGDGARATKYDVLFQFTNPNGAPTQEDAMILAKTAVFPGKTHTVINFKYRGRTIPVKGQTKYSQSWDCTFYLTQDHQLKAAFENWMEALDQQHNYMNVEDVNDFIEPTQKIHYQNGYTAPIIIHQRNFDDDAITSVYTLHNAFPIQISAPQLSADAVGQVLEFTVTFSYSYHTIAIQKGSSGNFIDSLVGKVKKMATDAIRGAVGQIAGNINNFVSDAQEKVMEKLEELNSKEKGLVKPEALKELGAGGSEDTFLTTPLSEQLSGAKVTEISNTLSTKLNDAKSILNDTIDDLGSRISGS
jgi:gas vesicle protein